MYSANETFAMTVNINRNFVMHGKPLKRKGNVCNVAKPLCNAVELFFKPLQHEWNLYKGADAPTRQVKPM